MPSRSDSPKSGSHPTGDARCQKPRCVGLKDAVVAANTARKKAEKDYSDLKKIFDAKVKSESAGLVRQVHAELSIATSTITLMEKQARESSKKRNFARAREGECVDLLADKKALTRQVRLLESLALAAAKKRAVAERFILSSHASLEAVMRSTIDLQASECVRKLKKADERIARGELEVSEAAEREVAARRAEEEAVEAAEETLNDLAAATSEAADTKYETMLADRREARLRAKCDKLAGKDTDVSPTPTELTADERMALSRVALAMRDSRERDAIRGFLAARKLQPRNLCVVLKEGGVLSEMIFKTKEGYDLYFDATKALFRARSRRSTMARRSPSTCTASTIHV